METEHPLPELAKREKNFYHSEEPSTEEGLAYYAGLQNLAEFLEDIAPGASEKDSDENMLHWIFSSIYDFVCRSCLDYRLFIYPSDIYNDAFEACYFISLCMFLQYTKKLNGKSLRRFIYDNDPNVSDLRAKDPYEHYNKEGVTGEPLSRADAKLRQYRNRLFSNRTVNHDATEWHAMSESSEHEWLLYFDLNNADEKIQDTAKRTRTLHNGINDIIESSENRDDIPKLECACDNFMSKAKKIRYEDFLQLEKFYFDHIQKDKTYYGINLYRLEKEVLPFNIASEINRLLDCKDEKEEIEALDKFYALQDIHFPKLYEYFYALGNKADITDYSRRFVLFMDMIVRSSRLIIDKFIDDGLLGEDWKSVMLSTINDLAPSVLYDPKNIEFVVTPESQDAFLKIICNPVYQKVYAKINSINLAASLVDFDDIE